MIHLRCRLRAGIDQPAALTQLKSAGLSRLAIVEDPSEGALLYGEISPDALPLLHRPPLLFLIEEAAPYDPKIDWNDQWASSGATYRNGFVFVDLGASGNLKLKPGPGFGDLSHPTTQLMIDLMEDHMTGREVVDIGSGSGVLTLAALRFGAQEAVGIEIDRSAIRHAQENAELNGLEKRIHFLHPADLDLTASPDTIYLMNMIEGEQRVVLDDLGLVGSLPGHWFISGVLAEERQSYLRSVDHRGWTLKGEKERDGWLSFHFQQM